MMMNDVHENIIKGLAVIAVLLSALTSVATTTLPQTFEAAIDSTDNYLSKRQFFSSAKEKRIAEVYAGNSVIDANGAISLGREYRRYNVDSAARYFNDAIHLAEAEGDDSVRRQATLELAAVNPLRGIIKESVDMFESVDPTVLHKDDRLTYFDKGFDVYVATAAFYADNPLGRNYTAKALTFSDSLASYLPAGSAHQLYHKGWNAMHRGDMPTALAELHAALEQSDFGQELYARVAATLADYYQTYQRDPDKAAYYLALSSMSDIAAGTKETTSLQRLGLELYRRGDISRAYRYLSTALDNSIESGSKIRTIEEINTLPVVTKAYNDKDASRIRLLYILVFVLTAVVIAFGALAWFALRSKQRLSAYRTRLTLSNSQKDAYINQILAICSSYIERIEDLNRLVVRKVKAGQGQDLCRMVESGEMLRDQSDKFLNTFDRAFFNIYPDFVEKLNDLLRSDACFSAVCDGKLTPELRIAAFMRLGVDDSTKISRLLGLSLNTVYTYRNKLRNRAVNRDSFELDLKNIGDLS